MTERRGLKYKTKSLRVVQSVEKMLFFYTLMRVVFS